MNSKCFVTLFANWSDNLYNYYGPWLFTFLFVCFVARCRNNDGGVCINESDIKYKICKRNYDILMHLQFFKINLINHWYIYFLFIILTIGSFKWTRKTDARDAWETISQGCQHISKNISKVRTTMWLYRVS